MVETEVKKVSESCRDHTGRADGSTDIAAGPRIPPSKKQLADTRRKEACFALLIVNESDIRHSHAAPKK